MPDLNLDRLKAVSPELVELKKQWRAMDNNTALSRKYLEASHKIDVLIPAIAADLLRLAEENEIRNEIIAGYRVLGSGYVNNNQRMIDAANDLIKIGKANLIAFNEEKKEAYKKGYSNGVTRVLKIPPLTPASAGSAKIEEE